MMEKQGFAWRRVGDALEPAGFFRVGIAPVLLILFVAFAVRLGLLAAGVAFQSDAALERPDSSSYVEPAQSFRRSGSFLSIQTDEVTGETGARYATLRPPGYPFYLAVLLRWGHYGNSLIWYLGLVLPGALAVWPVMEAAARLGGKRAAWWAGLLFALHVTAVANSPLVLSDSMFTFIAAWLLLLVMAAKEKPSYFLAGLIGVVAGAATLVRPAGMFWLVPGAVLLAVAAGGRWTHRVAHAVLFLLLFAATLLPWMHRNAAIGAGWRVDTNSGNTLLYHNAANFVSLRTGRPAEEIRREWRSEDAAAFRADPARFATEDSRVAYRERRAKGIILQAPLAYAWQHVQPGLLMPDVTAFLELLALRQGERGTLDVLNREGWIAAVRHYAGGLPLWVWPLLAVVTVPAALTLLGALAEMCRRGGSLWFWLLAGAFVLYHLVLPGSVVMPRYQLPALPLLCALAGCYCARWRERGRHQAARQITGVGLFQQARMGREDTIRS